MTKVAFPGQRDTLAGLTAGSARSLLFTVLGVMTWPVGGSVRTATLVQILDGLGIEEQTARQAIARAAASDWIVPERRGREVSWSLSARLVAIFRDGVALVSSVSDPYAEWDGRWLAVLVTIPHELRASRRPLYAGLTWAGFGDPAPGNGIHAAHRTRARGRGARRPAGVCESTRSPWPGRWSRSGCLPKKSSPVAGIWRNLASAITPSKKCLITSIRGARSRSSLLMSAR